jgi:hypothetical protein
MSEFNTKRSCNGLWLDKGTCMLYMEVYRSVSHSCPGNVLTYGASHILVLGMYLLTELSPSWEAANYAVTQEHPSILRNLKVHHRVHKSPPLIPILSQIDPVHTISSYLSLRSVLILSTHLHLGLSGGLFPSGFPTNILYQKRLFIQGICPDPRLLMNFCNKLIFLRWGVVSPMLNPQAGGPPIVGCPWLLMQYIRSYPPYLEAVSSICNLRTRHSVVSRDPPNMGPGSVRIHNYPIPEWLKSLIQYMKV